MEKDRLALCQERLKKERKRLGKNQSEFADFLGYDSQKTISQLENGHVELSIKRAAELAQKLGIRQQYILGFDDFRTVSDFDDAQFSASTPQMEYLASMGFSFRPCYVWNPSIFAAVMGFALIDPYLNGNFVINDMFKNRPIDEQREICNLYFDFSEWIHYADIENTAAFIPLLLKDMTRIHSGECNAKSIASCKAIRLGFFELSENPCSNSDFTRNYETACSTWNAIYGNASDLLQSQMYCENEYPVYEYSQVLALKGFLSGSFIECRYAFSENGTLKKYVDFDFVDKLVGALDSSTTNIVHAMLG